MNVPVYARFQEWLGRGPALEGMWEAWRAGDRKQALNEISDEVVDALVIHGSAEHCRARINDYFANGVTTAALAVLPLDRELDQWTAMRSLAPQQ